MRIRKAIVDVLYEIASAACQLADSLASSNDDEWRERRWKQFDADKAKSWDGPPLTEDPPKSSRGYCFMLGGPCQHAPHCPVLCERWLPNMGPVVNAPIKPN